MTQLNDLAGRLLRFEQQLTAYQKLHTDELAELWQMLNTCKRTLITVLPPQTSDKYFSDSLAATAELKIEEEQEGSLS
jgi:hypothetical protein